MTPWIERERSFGVWIHAAATRAWVARLLYVVSRLADGWIWYAAILIAWVGGGPDGTSCAVRMIAVASVNLLIYRILKRTIARPRPFHACPDIRACAPPLDEFSFPSGHVLHAVSFSIVLSAYYPGLAWWVWPFTILVALSRLVLGLHYLSDVVVGALIGALVAGVSFNLL